VAQRVAIVTGAAGGLGSAVAGLLDADGVRTALVDVDAAGLDQVAHRLPNARTFPADLARSDTPERLVGEVSSELGPVGILVNAAAILARRSLEEATPEHWDEVFAINARAPFFLSRAVFPGMREQGWGRIVNVTSTGVYAGGMTMTSAAYESSKGAVAVFTKMFAREGARHGILVNALCPGGMRTQMLLRDTPQHVLDMVEEQIPVGRLAEPVEMARLIQWLVSDQNTYATGAAFDVTGGLSMHN
jgi:NAD(P)-dependent dehydrogenase (short-subunit alcohol dehydrogenase family)